MPQGFVRPELEDMNLNINVDTLLKFTHKCDVEPLYKLGLEPNSNSL